MADFCEKDYFVVAYNILSTTYCHLRDKGQKNLCSDLDSYLKNKYNLNDSYYKYIVDSLIENKLLDFGIEKENNKLTWYYSITSKGIEYIFFDKAMNKAQDYLNYKAFGEKHEQK
ncbi:hypothetical protein FC52_GL000307 [Lactobacillus pasteurii DSM 23907 = CRBIP 24.76]|uniref:Uncharacterized protein n=1 Tax=Lactobacillus pasteurii DSM 23907 = CRBIP 24.76 TaxID=1423790 RepID=I7LDZ4_9LACO|nr:hypothetical protein [Lactobacillus pasteurii]KRK08609.1 hypothetical protein FC52_GL000307 [Lactobacillus pasteurii DSM 23907 = CRBIP 24.76]TDG76569.1 hypothetical protein C5L33_001328 [Lactobacillus pasteurii]CCI85338.1 Protein of unknown function [Lactobacillus pasteurii DSM 23907 = CRBIP 24.76]